jgi:hypothetical protein
MTSVAVVQSNSGPADIVKADARELTPSTSASFSFPVGYHDLHPDISINFQLNRFYGLWLAKMAICCRIRNMNSLSDLVSPRVKLAVCYAS